MPSQSHSLTRPHGFIVEQSPPSHGHLRRAVTSVAQSPPSTSHHLASLSPALPIACSVEALRVPSSFQSSRGINRMKKHLDQGGGGGGSSTFYAAPLAFSGPNSGNEGDDINDANLQQVMEDFDD
ncbi:uncharacterized protein LOC130932436 [Arachis stenosperma]|uniref:uncharacterized protein LOC130932436 n=1 Tax=Arachis stenosperma TaxID=217475 RepID=UPI0025ACF658|nr:uncharacterized protein LOC130932436 [Arachis stenosperma]